MTENAKQIQSHYDTRATILDIMKASIVFSSVVSLNDIKL